MIHVRATWRPLSTNSVRLGSVGERHVRADDQGASHPRRAIARFRRLMATAASLSGRDFHLTNARCAVAWRRSTVSIRRGRVNDRDRRQARYEW